MFSFAEARAHMVESQVRTNDVTDPQIQRSIGAVPRELFTPAGKKAVAYSDDNVRTDDGRWLMRPRDFAKLIQAADIEPTDIVLDIACGRGYSTCILAALADTVVGLEDNDAMVEKATQMLAETGVMNAAVVKGELKVGASAHGPFDVIFVNGAVSSVPKSWIEQLSGGGRLAVIESAGPIGKAKIYTKVGNAVGDRVVFDAAVPTLPGFEPKSEFVF